MHHSNLFSVVLIYCSSCVGRDGRDGCSPERVFTPHVVVVIDLWVSTISTTFSAYLTPMEREKEESSLTFDEY
jgi:hypothetical protein